MSVQERLPINYPSETANLRQTKRVLVAEDDHVNRWLATRLLEQKGYSVSAVTTSEAALAAFEKESFDLILLNPQMPLPNGLDATSVIRQQEEHLKTRVPIIAFTSEAKIPTLYCHWQAGIDSYLSKPIRTEEFYRRVEAVLKLNSHSFQTEPSPTVFDCEEVLARMNCDIELLQNTARMFLNSAPHLLSAMRRAVAKDDPYNLDFAAHRLKGSALNLSAYGVVELAERLELMGSTRNLSEAQTTIAKLEEEVCHFKVTFEATLQALASKAPQPATGKAINDNWGIYNPSTSG